MNRIAGLVLAAATTLVSTASFAQDLAVQSAAISSIEGRRAQLNVKLRRPGAGQQQSTIKVFWVPANGARREIYSGNGRFDGTAAGMSNSIQVDAPGDDGKFEVVVPGTNSKHEVVFRGAEMSFDGARIEQVVGGNPNRKIFLVLKNAGPGQATGCRVTGTLAENGAARPFEYNVPNLPARAKYEKQIPFNFRASNNAAHNKVVASVTCPSDPVPTNNGQTTTLR